MKVLQVSERHCVSSMAVLLTNYYLGSCGGLVTKSYSTLVTPWTVACQSPLSKGFPWREYWSGLPFPSPGDLPDVGIKPMSTALAGKFFTIEPPGKKMVWFKCQSEEQSSVCVCVFVYVCEVGGAQEYCS